MSRPTHVVRAPRVAPPQLTLLGSALTGDPTAISAEPGVVDGNVPAEAWKNGFAYVPEQHVAAALRDPCDFSTVDLPALPTPAAAVLAAVAGGTIVAGTYGYRVSATNGNGETLASAQTTIVTGSTGSIRVTWNRVHDATGYRLYGRTPAGELFMVAVADNPIDDSGTLTYVDDGSLTPAGALPAGNTTAGPGTYTNIPAVEFYPYLIVVEDECSTFGFEARDYIGRARRLLDNAVPNAIEREFWSGGLARLTGNGNNYLTNQAKVVDLTPGSGPPTVKRGMQILEDALAANGFGGQGMIHTQPQTSPDLTGARRVGNRLYSVMDNLIVPGSGYPGTGPNNVAPAAGTAWMYATDLVSVWMDPNEYEVTPDTFAEAVDRDVNLVTYRAMRVAAATFDASIQVGVRVTLAV